MSARTRQHASLLVCPVAHLAYTTNKSEMKLTLSREMMNYTGSLAIRDRQLPTPSAHSVSATADNLGSVVYCFRPRNNPLSTPQRFFPPQVTVEKWKIFFRVERLFPLSNALQRPDQPQENFPLSSFLEICEVPNLSMNRDSVAQKLTVTYSVRDSGLSQPPMQLIEMIASGPTLAHSLHRKIGDSIRSKELRS